MDNEKSPKIPKKYNCVLCDYITFNKKDFNKHLSTDKHKKIKMDNLDNKMDNVDNEKSPNHLVCHCGRIYKYKSGLCKHKKSCKSQEIISVEEYEKLIEDCNDTNIVLKLLKQNDEFKEMIKEQNKMIFKQNDKLINLCKDKSIPTINNAHGNINSNNKTFNLNVFLNEHCKDAMNLMDFVDSLKLQLSDLENVGKLGYVEGISNIIVRNLKALDIHKRPVHCSDSKREVMYIKDEDKWEKENENKLKLRKAIKRVANKNQRLLPKFKEEHPDCGKYHSKFSDQYNKLVVESMGGSGDNDLEKEDKIIKKIAKEVVIDKNY